MPDELAEHDTRFSLPACDDPPSTEIGVVVMGLPPRELLACLGMTVLAGDPAAVTLLIDHIRHAGAARLTFAQLVEAGLARWHAAEAELSSGGVPRPSTARVRHGWSLVHQALSRHDAADSPAAVVFLTACWLRAPEINREEPRDVVSEVAAG
jgi:hypothetical protein